MSHTLSTAAGPHPTDGALAALDSALQMAALPPPQTLANVSEDSHLPPGWDRGELMHSCIQNILFILSKFAVDT